MRTCQVLIRLSVLRLVKRDVLAQEKTRWQHMLYSGLLAS
jgi:hypothetical protein